MNDSHIIIQNASLRFRSYRNPSPNLKETVVDKFTKKSYGGLDEFDALKDINLEILPGDRLGILGLNGAGKSTLLKMIVGIYPPQKGLVSVRGKITPMIELGTGFDAELSGRENIYLNGTLIGRSYKQMKQLEDKIIEFSELGDKIDMPIKYYSSGMHARLAFSIGAIADPEILIMDEIFAAGDAQFVQKSLHRLHTMFDKAHILILVSHSEKHILNICNKAIVLNKGELVMQGSTVDCVDHYMANIVQDPSWTGAAQWIGDPLSFKDRKIIEQLSAAHALSHEAAETDEESFFEPPVDEEATEPSNNQEIAPVTPLNSEIFSPDAAISLGENWHWYEHEAGEVFRWVTNDAELRLPACSNGDEIAELNLDVEPGPSINRIHCTLKLIDEQNQLIAQGRFSGRQVVTLVPTEDLSGKTVKLQVETDNLPLSSEDVRILNFRVFNVSLKMKDSVKSENDHPVHAADTFYGISKTALESKSANESEENLAVHENFAPPIREAASSR